MLVVEYEPNYRFHAYVRQNPHQGMPIEYKSPDFVVDVDALRERPYQLT